MLALNISDLHDGALNYIHDEETARLTRAPPSPTKAVQDMLSTTWISDPHCECQQTGPTHLMPPLPINLFVNFGGKGNLFKALTQQNAFSYQGMSPGNLGIRQGASVGRPPSQQSGTL